jgi:hypothetical protein
MKDGKNEKSRCRKRQGTMMDRFVETAAHADQKALEAKLLARPVF